MERGFLKQIDNFDESDHENINIKFTTIQQLHIDLNNTKENSVTYEDFQDKKIVLIADEAHHLNSGTKSGNLLEVGKKLFCRSCIRILKISFSNLRQLWIMKAGKS
jgi:type III restriction enzyme